VITDGTFGAVLRTARINKGWSQQKLAVRMNHAGYSSWQQATATRSERAGRPVPIGEVLVLASLLDIDLNALIVPIEPEPPCSRCDDEPPEGFTCNDCGTTGAAS